VTDVAALLDAALEAPVVPSFSRFGYLARRRLFAWRPLDEYDLRGRVIAITGATSGIGRAAATQFARDGAALVVIGRDAARNDGLVDDLRSTTGNEAVQGVTADLGDLDAVREAAARISELHDRLDVLVHNAGALANEHRTTSRGLEVTVASQVVGPFLLTSLLLDVLAASAPARVVTVSSGGMYTAPLAVSDLEMDAAHYRGTEQYARAKRAQVTLNELWADRCRGGSIVFQSMHPGWADSPGLAASLPGFRRVMRPLLRDAAQGADTLVWLAADDGEPLARSGAFWLDRRVRPIHRLRATARSDTPARRQALWDRVVAASGAPAPTR
jgi:NAD(P)-dependent dehydrogenase (short-subunit alcohol dehydrogenase family)